MQLYENIQLIAKKRNISINKLEHLAGISSGSICKWNKISPSVQKLKSVADILDCTMDDLLSESNLSSVDKAEKKIS